MTALSMFQWSLSHSLFQTASQFMSTTTPGAAENRGSSAAHAKMQLSDCTQPMQQANGVFPIKSTEEAIKPHAVNVTSTLPNGDVSTLM